MPLPKALVLILAGGAGNRLELLTATRAKPAVPFAGRFRLIDFPLSNCQHAQIADVWISVQYNPASLTRHLSNGRPWDLDRTTGGMLTLPPRQGQRPRRLARGHRGLVVAQRRADPRTRRGAAGGALGGRGAQARPPRRPPWPPRSSS
jgi:ADP-glucose pyrophosphorylase